MSVSAGNTSMVGPHLGMIAAFAKLLTGGGSIITNIDRRSEAYSETLSNFQKLT